MAGFGEMMSFISKRCFGIKLKRLLQHQTRESKSWLPFTKRAITFQTLPQINIEITSWNGSPAFVVLNNTPRRES